MVHGSLFLCMPAKLILNLSYWSSNFRLVPPDVIIVVHLLVVIGGALYREQTTVVYLVFCDD